MRDGICVNVLYVILLKCEMLYVWWCIYDTIKIRVGVCLKAFYMILLKWDIGYFWKLFIYFYVNERWYMSKSYIYDIFKMIYVIRPNIAYRLLLKW